MFSNQLRQIRPRCAGLLVSGLLSLCAPPPAGAQLNVSNVRDFGAGALSHEQRYQDLVIRTDQNWNYAISTHKKFKGEAHTPELLLPTFQKELGDLITQAQEKDAVINIRKDAEQLRQEIDSLMKKGGLVIAARADIAAKERLIQSALGKLEEELDAIVRACKQTLRDSSKWKDEFDLNIQVRGADVARTELQNHGFIAFRNLENAWEMAKKNRLPPTPAPQSRNRPADLRELSKRQLQELLAQENALPVPDVAWVKEISSELSNRLFDSSMLDKLQEEEAAADAAQRERAEKKRAEKSKSNKKDAEKRSPRAF